jgi:hypothetical protein
VPARADKRVDREVEQLLVEQRMRRPLDAHDPAEQLYARSGDTGNRFLYSAKACWIMVQWFDIDVETRIQTFCRLDRKAHAPSLTLERKWTDVSAPSGLCECC